MIRSMDIHRVDIVDHGDPSVGIPTTYYHLGDGESLLFDCRTGGEPAAERERIRGILLAAFREILDGDISVILDGDLDAGA